MEMREREKDIEEVIVELANLSSIKYDCIREQKAKDFGIRVSTLDKEVEKYKKKDQINSEDPLYFSVPDLYSEEVNISELLDEIVSTIKCYIVCDEETAITTALWICFTWVIDDVSVAPIAFITAPEKRCGKSQLLSLIARLVNRPLVASNISPAAVFRVIEEQCPTLLIDEADTFLQNNEELRGVINSGHTRQTSYVIRTFGDDHSVKQFSTWGAKAICGIGSIPSTIEDRAIKLELRRKLPTEKVERLRHADPKNFEVICSKLARFSQDSGNIINKARPNLPDELNDRAQDNWEPLLAIADYAGDKWPELARKVALKISKSFEESEDLSTSLLSDIKDIFDKQKIGKIHSSDLIKSLIEDEEKCWATYNKGKEISNRQLSVLLKKYNIKSKDIRISTGVRKGYEREQFIDIFDRYLPSEVSKDSATTLQDTEDQVYKGPVNVADNKTCSATYSQSATLKSLGDKDCSVVADKIDMSDNNIFDIGSHYQEIFEERVGIYQFEAGLSQDEAEKRALEEIKIKYGHDSGLPIDSEESNKFIILLKQAMKLNGDKL